MRDFFERQDVARRLSARFALLLVGAVLGTVVVTAVVLAGLATLLAILQVVLTTSIEINREYWIDTFLTRFWLATGLVGSVVIGVAVLRTVQALGAGGVEVARQLGATRVLSVGDNPQYQQLMNVVEELTIASGVPKPKIFVLEDEDAINAFAAGIDPTDTVVGVTRGALERLNRSQLQGVLAHEFSHIVNQDVRINVQTLGAMQGIETIDSVARFFLRMGVPTRVNGSLLATVFGYALWLVGQIGVLFAAIVRMALTRQREFLADAAAVQYTRYPEGLCSALKLIAATVRQDKLQSMAAQPASHFFFVGGVSALDKLLASHPPLEVRIRRLDPEWDGALPTILPKDVAAAMDQPLQSIVDRRETVMLPVPNSIATECESPEQAQRNDAPPTRLEGTAHEGHSGDAAGISEADKQAFLATLAKVRAASAHQEYNPNVTHWPTLAATAAALVGALILYSWLTSL